MDEPSRNERTTGRGKRPAMSVSAKRDAAVLAATARAGSAATCSPNLQPTTPLEYTPQFTHHLCGTRAVRGDVCVCVCVCVARTR
jgi:hypothetical protein